MMHKTILKFVAGGLGLVAIAVGVLFLVQYVRYRVSPEYRTEQALKELERRYAEDTYGGSTPEETLQLFIDALKKGNVELASKYFVVEKQEKLAEDLTRINLKGLLDSAVNDLENAERGNDIDANNARFTVVNQKDEAITVINISRGTNGKWKILDF